jgi:hypothetical protein
VPGEGTVFRINITINISDQTCPSFHTNEPRRAHVLLLLIRYECKSRFVRVIRSEQVRKQVHQKQQHEETRQDTSSAGAALRKECFCVPRTQVSRVLRSNAEIRRCGSRIT